MPTGLQSAQERWQRNGRLAERSKKRRIIWTPQMDKYLGSIPDDCLGEVFGCSATSVLNRRRKRRVDTIWHRRVWIPPMDAHLMTITDEEATKSWDHARSSEGKTPSITAEFTRLQTATATACEAKWTVRQVREDQMRRHTNQLNGTLRDLLHQPGPVPVCAEGSGL